MLKCYQKAQTPGKPSEPNDDGCIDKVKLKFDGGAEPEKGCFAKLETKSGNDCLPPLMNTASVEALVDGCVSQLVGLLTTPTTTTTSSTTPTTAASTTSTTGPVTSTTTTTTSSTTSTTGAAFVCSGPTVSARIVVPYNLSAAPPLSGIRLRVAYPPTVSMPNIPSTSFVDPSRLTDLTGAGGSLVAQDLDTNGNSVEDTLDVIYFLTGTFPPGNFARAQFDCNVGAMLNTANFPCNVISASDVVGNDVPNPQLIPCSVNQLSAP